MGISQLVHDIKPYNISTSRPGKVGSVGEVVVRTRFRQSCAEMPWSFDPYWSSKRSKKLGSNVQDGYSTSYVSKGGPAESNLAAWNGNRSFKHQYGYTMHDIRPLDTSRVAIHGGLPQFSWKRKVANTRIVKSGSLFMPMGYRATGIPRGGSYPTAQGFGGTTPASQAYDPLTAPTVELDPNGPRPNNATRAGPTRLGAQRLGVAIQGLRI